MVVGVNARHQFEVGVAAVAQLAIPSPAKLFASPGPLFFARCNVPVGHMNKSPFGGKVVSSKKIERRFAHHVAGGNRNILVAAQVVLTRTVLIGYSVIGVFGNREAAHVAHRMVGYVVHIGRKKALIRIVHLNCHIGPPEEGLGKRGSVVQTAAQFD